jgi:S-adenosylmethionine uptake transporter
MQRAPVRPHIAFLVASMGIATYSIMDVVMKGLVLAIGVYDAMFWRMIVASVLSFGLWALSGIRVPDRATLKVHAVRGAVSTVMALLFFWGLARVPLAQGIALTYIAPLLALLLAGLLLGEKVGRGTALASLLAFAGVVVILLGQARSDLGEDAFWGAVAILASAVCSAWNIILMRQQAQVADPAEIAVAQSALVTLMLLPAAPFLSHIPAAEHWPAIAGGAALATASMLLLGWAYARAEASYLAAVEYSSFLWASLFGFLVFRERLSPWTVAGAVMIVGGCLLAARRVPATPAEAEAMVA